MMPPAMASMLATRNRDNMPVIDYLTIGCHRKGALDKFLVDAKNFVGVPKAYVRKLQEIQKKKDILIKYITSKNLDDFDI